VAEAGGRGMPTHPLTWSSAKSLTDRFIDKNALSAYVWSMPGDAPGEDLSDIPTLLRRARGGYGNTIAMSLATAGFDDLPRNGPFLLGGMAKHGARASDLVSSLSISRQAASQLIDTLVLRGYLTRRTNADDRRRMDIALTDRGRAAATVIRAAVEQVDKDLAGMLSPAEVAGLRAGLVALSTIKERTKDGASTDL
jgi:DNA-binding MarR family transcriptional regulator